MSTERRIVIFIGPPGAGKGSLSQLCVKELGWAQLSTGNLCRYHITEQTELGKQIDLAIKSGKLISDGVIVDMVDKALPETFKQSPIVILDGFPRTVAQAQALENKIAEIEFPVAFVVVHLNLSDHKVLERLGSRLICTNKACQAVYSLSQDSLKPEQQGICDVCKQPLMKRSDDEEKSVRERLLQYHKHADDLLQFYKDRHYALCEIDVDQPLNETFDQLVTMMNNATL